MYYANDLGTIIVYKTLWIPWTLILGTIDYEINLFIYLNLFHK